MTPNPGLIWPFRRFRKLHLQHHADDRLTDPFDDPESFYRAAWWYDGLPRIVRAVLAFSNTLLGRLVLGPPLGAIALLAGDLRQFNRQIALAWTLHVIGLVPVLWCVTELFEMSLWLYLLVVVWPSAAVISLRTFAEHRWHETPDGRTIIVERSPLAFLFLNNNLHLVHHSHPSVAWYRLPTLYRAKADVWRARNQGYVFRCYWPLLRAYFLKPKEPVSHPVWHRRQASLDKARSSNRHRVPAE